MRLERWIARLDGRADDATDADGKTAEAMTGVTRTVARLNGLVLKAQREALIKLHDDEIINGDVMRPLQHELDLESLPLGSTSIHEGGAALWSPYA